MQIRRSALADDGMQCLDLGGTPNAHTSYSFSFFSFLPFFANHITLINHTSKRGSYSIRYHQRLINISALKDGAVLVRLILLGIGWKHLASDIYE